jgi:hypothetical protein
VKKTTFLLWNVHNVSDIGQREIHTAESLVHDTTPIEVEIAIAKLHRLRVLDNKVLSRISGPRKDELMGWWRKLHNEELRDLYSLQV